MLIYSSKVGMPSDFWSMSEKPEIHVRSYPNCIPWLSCMLNFALSNRNIFFQKEIFTHSGNKSFLLQLQCPKITKHFYELGVGWTIFRWNAGLVMLILIRRNCGVCSKCGYPYCKLVGCTWMESMPWKRRPAAYCFRFSIVRLLNAKNKLVTSLTGIPATQPTSTHLGGVYWAVVR